MKREWRVVVDTDKWHEVFSVYNEDATSPLIKGTSLEDVVTQLEMVIRQKLWYETTQIERALG